MYPGVYVQVVLIWVLSFVLIVHGYGNYLSACTYLRAYAYCLWSGVCKYLSACVLLWVCCGDDFFCMGVFGTFLKHVHDACQHECVPDTEYASYVWCVHVCVYACVWVFVCTGTMRTFFCCTSFSSNTHQDQGCLFVLFESYRTTSRVNHPKSTENRQQRRKLIYLVPPKSKRTSFWGIP
jgi:hypothetical protein